MKDIINLKHEDYKKYIKTIIFLEMGIKEEWILERMALKYIEDKEISILLNEKFEEYLEEIIKKKRLIKKG